MTNMIQNAKDQVAQLVAASYARAMETVSYTHLTLPTKA